MKKLSLVATLAMVLPLSTFVVACDSAEDTDARAALEKEALERELDLALQPDTTAEPELADVAIEELVLAAEDLQTARELAPRLKRVVPGIRLTGGARHDQARAASPQEAVANGADPAFVLAQLVYSSTAE